jgi:protein-L-isoaspartate(D-aspartate) O-methyltransferase
MMEDTYRHKGMRRILVNTLREKGITDERVVAAIEALPRHFFLDKAFEEQAYEDKPFPIGNDQTISQPYTVAYQSSLLSVEKRDRILEIGTGSGYQAAILSLLGGRVFTVERQETLFAKTRKLLETLGLGKIQCFLRDGTKGLPEFAPFDKILVTAGSTEIPEALPQQLKTGGRLVIPVGDEQGQKMIRITRLSETEFQKEVFDNFRFVPLLTGIVKSR